MSWGFSPIVTEFGPDGARHFELTFDGGFSYRVGVVTGGSPSIGQLRAGMDAMASQPAQTQLKRRPDAQGDNVLDEKSRLGLDARPSR